MHGFHAKKISASVKVHNLHYVQDLHLTFTRVSAAVTSRSTAARAVCLQSDASDVSLPRDVPEPSLGAYPRHHMWAPRPTPSPPVTRTCSPPPWCPNVRYVHHDESDLSQSLPRLHSTTISFLIYTCWSRERKVRKPEPGPADVPAYSFHSNAFQWVWLISYIQIITIVRTLHSLLPK